MQVNQYLKLSFQERGREVGRDIQSKVTQLPPQTNIIKVFEREGVGRRLLILGEPGAGKTTSLLKLAAALITQAKQDSTAPIPVIFELSAWKKDRQPIEEWLVEQLKDNYSIDLRLSQNWIQENRILPLLDGLDELGLIRQRLAIQKINQYLHQDIARKLVVCCRWEEYKQGQVQLYELKGAYYLKPSTESDIRDYLQRLNQQDLWQKIENEEAMRKLAQKPLFLNLMMTAFQGEVIVSESQLFADYVEEQLKRPLNPQKYPQATQGKLPYSHEDTKKWLTYLAGQLEADKLTVFFIEKMQPYWLNPGKERWLFRLIYGLIYGLINGLILGLINGLINGLMNRLILGLILGLIGGLILGLILGLINGLIFWEFKEYEIATEAFEFTWQGLKKGLIFGLILGLILGLINRLIFGLIGGLINGLILGLIIGLIRNLNVEIKSRQEPNQGIKESWKKSLIITLISSPFLMLIFLLTSLFTDASYSWIQSISLGLSGGLVISLPTGGQDLIQHLTLRLILENQRLIPRNYAHFLDYAQERKLIHRIGGQYRFLHDSLRKHFASQATIPERVIQ